jgi:para-aminobenzoate synthetase component 1
MQEVRVTVADVSAFKRQALAWATAQEAPHSGFVTLLNNNFIDYPHDPFPNRLFVGAKRVISLSGADAFQALHDAHRSRPSYLVGYLGYDLKNQLEDLTSRHPNRLGFPDAYFVEPEWILDFLDTDVIVRGEGNVDGIVEEIRNYLHGQVGPESLRPAGLPSAHGGGVGDEDWVGEKTLKIQCRVTPDEYMTQVRQIRQHILAGNVYELNYCIEFFAENAILDPLATYEALNTRSPMPFSSFVKLGANYVIGASPERFMRKQGRTLLSQPIKGTVRRSKDPVEDAALRAQLLNSEKERAENLMIVDLVRNDLARSAETGSVRVEELFGIYGFEQVYQMISTVSATLREDLSWADVLRNAFPMGSMTGAPKIRAMELIDELEVSRRGVYSGAIGFVTPDGDFDFNVVIRSLLYNAKTHYASFSVGSAITYDAEPAQEWDECLLKARAIREVLAG